MNQDKLQTLSPSPAVRSAAVTTAMNGPSLAAEANRRRKPVRAQPHGAFTRSSRTRRRAR